MIKQAVSAFAAAAVAVSFASAAFAEDANVVEKIPTTNFTLIGDDSNGAGIEDSEIILTNSFGGADTGRRVPETYLSYTAPEDGILSIFFECDKSGESSRNNPNYPRLYWADADTVTNSSSLYKENIGTITGGKTDSTGAGHNNGATFTCNVVKDKTYYLFGYAYKTRSLTFTLTDFRFTSTADITEATPYSPKEYAGTDKGFTANLTGGTDAGTINWYAKSQDATAYSKIGSVSTVLTGKDSTTFTAGLVISGMGDEASNYNIGASIN